MSNQEIRYLIKNELQYLKFTNIKSPHHINNIYKKYKFVFENDNSKSIKNLVYDYVNNIKSRLMCKECGSRIDFISFVSGYKFNGDFCCIRCRSIHKNKISFQKRHNDKFEYDWMSYTHDDVNMKIKCPIHGWFYQRPDVHRICDCNQCGNIKIGNTNSMSKEQFLIESNKKHNYKYKYDLTNYKNLSTKIKIICPIHGEFFQVSGNHKKGQGCPLCKKISISKKLTMPIKRQKEDFYKIHQNNYTYYWDTYINNSKKMKIKCNTCDNIFWQTPNNHKGGHGCPSCSTCKLSNGEKQIEMYLKNNNIKYIKQKKFKNCMYKCQLQFDFYLPKQNMCIEYDGIQHFECIEWFHKTEDEFNIYKLKDKIKNNFCFVEKIKLLRISYLEDKNINIILNNNILN